MTITLAEHAASSRSHSTDAILLTVGDSPVFEAAALIPGHWNGWAMPLFTREQAEAVLAWLNPLLVEDGDEPETMPEPTAEGLYPLGSGAWMWELADEAAVA